MARFLERRWSYKKLGVDAVYIFLEIAQTSVEPELRKVALVKAQQLARRMVNYYRKPARLKNPGDLLDALDLLAEAPHLKVNMNHLLRLATARYRRIRSAKELYQVKLANPSTLSTDDFFDLLINTFIMQKVELVYPGRFPVGFSLEDLMPAVITRKYLNFPTLQASPTPVQKLHVIAAEDDGFLATHVAYVFNFYGRIRLHRRDLPGLYKYLRANFGAALLRKDIELVAEFVDVFRSLGRNETNDALVRQGSFFLLEGQAKDGSWGPWKTEKDPYDAIHFSWCAVLGLRERFFMQGTRFERRLRSIFRRLRRRKSK